MFDTKRFRKDNNLTQKELADILGCGQSNISTLEKTGNNPTLSQVTILYSKFGKECVDEYFHDNVSNAELLGAAQYPLENMLRKVKMYSITPTATFTELSACFQDDSSYIWMLPESGEYIDDSYAIFEIRGESMEPTVRNHSRILCKQLPESRWQDAEGVIVISFKDMVVLKRVVKNSFYTDNCITLASDNTDPKYSHIEKVQLADVHAIFKAKRILSQDIN